ncbi:T9SS type A sorting domain-containing protein [Pedobacter arcticus]|uniref:T9SS type A sorting domain-containing protein n=1 Tax=Pedobacter arcticus TaxID=752140 RepID=UPI0002F0AA38|nr:T9SS type A sorting domain-containing protein [Pedobacter arcticus]
MKKIYLMVCLVVLMVSAQTQVFGQLLEWDFSTANATGSTYNDPNMLSSTLVRGGGAVVGGGYSYGFSIRFAEASNSYENAKTANAYIEFNVETTAEYMSLAGIDVKLRTHSSGAKNYRWAYKKAGDLDFTVLGATDSAFPVYNASADAGVAQPTLNLSSVATLQNVPKNTEVTFRLYGWGGVGTASTNTSAIGKSSSAAGSASLMLRGITTAAPVALSTNSEIASWQFSGLSGTTTGSVDATAKSANLNTVKLSRGAGLTAGNFATSYTSTLGISSVTLSDAVENNEYYQLELKSIALYKASLDELWYRYRRLANGPASYQWKYSLDNVNFTDIGSSGVFTAKSDGLDMYLDLSSIAALKNILPETNVIFRLYIWGNTSETGVTGFGRFSATTTAFNSIYIKGKLEEEDPLPIKLTSFTGKKELNGIRLNWQTASEQNNSYFEVYKSTTGKPNVLLGKVNGAGNSTATTNYSLMDYSPVNGTNYYQLQQVDKDGQRQEFDIISIKNSIDEIAQIKVHQKDASLQINIQGAIAGEGLLQIIDTNGRVVSKQTVSLDGGNNDVIEVPFVANKGIYIATLKTSTRILTTKFIW